MLCITDLDVAHGTLYVQRKAPTKSFFRIEFLDLTSNVLVKIVYLMKTYV